MDKAPNVKPVNPRAKTARNMEIVDAWKHRYREGLKPITLNDLAIRFNLSFNRVWRIIKRYGRNDEPKDS